VPAPDQKSVSILLVEDNPADARLVRKALEEHRVEGELMVLADGEKAIEFIRTVDAQSAECPALAIIDLNLPRKSGREVLEHIRLSARCRGMPVVVLSSSDAEQDRADAMRLGASRCLRKPSRLGEFLSLGAIFKAVLQDPSH
jgi:two-component system, chemotaxis family, response regulator Rcp1